MIWASTTKIFPTCSICLGTGNYQPLLCILESTCRRSKVRLPRSLCMWMPNSITESSKEEQRGQNSNKVRRVLRAVHQRSVFTVSDSFWKFQSKKKKHTNSTSPIVELRSQIQTFTCNKKTERPSRQVRCRVIGEFKWFEIMQSERKWRGCEQSRLRRRTSEWPRFTFKRRQASGLCIFCRLRVPFRLAVFRWWCIFVFVVDIY